MKTINLVLVAALTLFTLPVFADSTSNQPAPSLANQTASLAKSTLGMAQDSAITTYIYAKLASHPDLSNANLDISTNSGKVVLNGIVNNDDQAKEIQQIAATTAGVKSVDVSKIIISQQENALYVKTSADKPIPQTNQVLAQAEEPVSKSAEPLAQPEMQLSSADPLLTNNDDKLDNKNEPSVRMEKRVKTPQASQKSHKCKTHAHSKHKHKKKKALHSLKKLKPKHLVKKEPPKKKILAHHKKNKALAKHHSKQPEKHLAKQNSKMEKLNKSQLASRKNTNESVGQMTNDFLKTALMANKSIPEE